MSSKQETDKRGNDLMLKTAKRMFDELLGEEEGKNVLPQFLKNRTLTVSCLSSAAADAIRTRQQEIVDLINKKLGEKEVDRIRYLL